MMEKLGVTEHSRRGKLGGRTQLIGEKLCNGVSLPPATSATMTLPLAGMAASPAARKAVQLSQEAPQGSSCCVAWFHIGTPLISSLQSSGFVHLIHRCLVEYGHRVHRLIVTCTSADACAHLRSELRAKGQVTVLHLSLGVDGATSMGLFLNQHRPQIGLILDTPALPNFVLLASAFGVRLCLLDTLQGSFRAERYWQAWASMRKLLNSVLDPPPSYLSLTEDARKNFNIAHGLTDPHSNACQPWRPTAEEALALKRGLGHQRPLWLAANILPGEEDIIGAAHLSLAPHHPGLCTVLLPDDASRCEEVSHILRSKYKLRVTLWPPKPGAHRAEEGGGDDGPEAWHDVLLVAEAALLPLLFSVCEVVLIGSGALENCSAIRCMAEAAAAGCALLLGPSAGPRAVHLAQQLNAATLDMAGVGEQMEGGWMGRQASSLLPLPPLHNEVPCGSVGGSSNGAEGQGRHLGGLGAEGDAPAGGCGQVGSNSGTEWGGNGGWHAFFRAPQYEQGLRSVIAGVCGASVNRPPPPQQEAPHSAAAVAPDPDSESSKAAPSIAASLNAASSNGTDRQTAGHLQLQPNPMVVAHQPSIKVPCTPPVVLVPPTPSLGTASQPIPSPATQQLGDASAHRKEPPALSQQSSPEQHPLQASSLLESTTDDLPSCSPIPINTPFLHHPPPAHLLTHSRNSSLSSFASSPPPSMLRAPFFRNPLASLSSWLTSESSTSTQGSAAPVHPLPPSVSQHAATGSMDSWGSGSSAGHTHKLPHHHPQNTTHPPGGGAQQGQARGPSRLAHTTSSSGIAADEAVGARQPASPPARGFKVGSTGSVFDSGYFLADGDGTPSRAGSYEGHQGEQRQQQDQQQKQQQQQQRQPSPSRQLPALENIRKSMEGGSSGGGAGQGSMPIEREASLQLGISSATDTLPSKPPTSNSNPSCSTDQAPPSHESPSTLTSLTPPLPSSLVGASDARGPPSPTLLRPPSRKEDSLSSGGSCSTTPTADDALPAFNASVQNLVGLPACQQQQHHGALAQTAPPHHNHHHHHHHCHHPQHHPQPQQQQQLQEQQQSSEPCNRGEHVSGSGAGCGGDATVELGSCSSSATSRHSQKQGCAGERQHPFGGPHRQQHQQQEEDGDLPAPDKEESFRFQQTSASRSNSAAAAAAAAFFGTHLRPTPGPSLSSITPPCPIDTTEIPSHNTQCQRITISGWHRHPELHQGMEEEKEAEERHPRASHESAALFGAHLRPIPAPPPASIAPLCPTDTHKIPSHHSQYQRNTVAGWHRHPELLEGEEGEEEVEETRPPAPHESSCNGLGGMPQQQAQQQHEHAGAVHDAGMLLAAACEQPARWGSHQQHQGHQQGLQPCRADDRGCKSVPSAGWGEADADGRIRAWQSHVQSLCVDNAAEHGSRGEVVLVEGGARETACGEWVRSVKGGDQGREQGGDLSTKQVALLQQAVGGPGVDGSVSCSSSGSGRQPRGLSSSCLSEATTAARTAVYAPHSAHGRDASTSSAESARPLSVQSGQGPNGTRIGFHPGPPATIPSSCSTAPPPSIVPPPGTASGSSSCSRRQSDQDVRNGRAADVSGMRVLAPLPHLHNVPRAPPAGQGDAHGAAVEERRPLTLDELARLGSNSAIDPQGPHAQATDAHAPYPSEQHHCMGGSPRVGSMTGQGENPYILAHHYQQQRRQRQLPSRSSSYRSVGPEGRGGMAAATAVSGFDVGCDEELPETPTSRVSQYNATSSPFAQAIFDRPCPFSTHTQAVRAQSVNSRAASTCDGDSDNVGGSRGGMDASAAAAVASVSAAKELFTPSSKSCSPEPSALAAPRRTAKTSTSASNLQPATYPRRRHHPTRSCTSPLGAAAAVGPDAASRSCPVGTIAAPSTPRAAVLVSPRLGTLLTGITTSAASSPRPPLPLPPHAPAPPASPFHNTAHAAAPLHSTFPPAAGLAGVAGPLPAAAAFAAVPTEESNSALDAAAWRASGFEPQGQASPPCTPTSRMSALGAASSPFANPTFDRPCPFKTSRTGSMHTSPIDPAKRTGGPTTPRTHPPSPSLSRGGGQDISKWSPAQAPPPVPTDSPHSSSNSCGPWTVMTCPARPSACGGPHGEHGAASWGYQGKENGGWGSTPREGPSRPTSHARKASNTTDAANALADLGNNMCGGSGLGGGGGGAAAGGGSIKTCPSSQSQTLLHRYASSNRHHQEHLAASCLPTPSLLPLPLPAAQQQQPPHDPPSNNRPLFPTVPDALNPFAASAQFKPTAPSADVLQLCTQGQPGGVSPVMPPWILGMSLLAPPPLAPAYEGNAVLLPHEVTGLPCLPPPSAAGSCGVPQSPRRMDGKAPDLGSSSAMFFCADNPMHGPTTPQSFCSSACMAPLTSSSSGTPDYAAAPQNLVPHCSPASASTMRRLAHQPTSSGCRPSQNCSSSVLGGNTPHEQQRQQRQQQQQQQVEVEVADRSAADAGEESAKGSPSGTAESAKGSPGATADRSTEVEKANSCGQLHFSQYQRGQQEQACPGQGQQPYGGPELHQQELEEEPAAPAYEEEHHQQHQGLELHPQPHQPQCSSAKMATLARNAAKRARTLAESALRSSLATTTALAASTATASSPHSSATRRLHQSISQGHVTRAAATRCAQLTALATEMETLAVGLEAAAHAAKDAHTSAVSALQALPTGTSGVGHGGGVGPTEVGPCKGGGRRHSCSSAFSRSLHGGDLVPPAGMHEGGASERQVGRLVGRQVGSPIVPACARRSLDSSSRPLSRYSNPAAAMLRMKEEHSFKGSRRHSSSSSSALSRSQDAGDQVHDGEASGRRRSCSSALSRSLHAGDLAPPAGVRDGKASGGPSVPPCARRSLDSCRPPSRSSNLAAAMLRMKEERTQAAAVAAGAALPMHLQKAGSADVASVLQCVQEEQELSSGPQGEAAAEQRNSAEGGRGGEEAPAPLQLPQPTSVLAPPSMRSPYRRLFESQPNSSKKEGNGSSGGALAPAQHHASDSHAQATPASDSNAQATPTADSHAQVTPASDSHIQAKAAAAPLSPSCSQPISFVAPTAGPGAPTNASPVDHSLPPASGSLTLPLPPIIPPLEPSCPSCEDRRDPCKSNGSRAGSPPRLSAKSSTSSDDPSAPLIHTYSRDPSCVALQALIPEAATAAAAVSSAAAASAAAAAAACPPPPTVIVAQEVIPRSRSPQLLLTHAPPALEGTESKQKELSNTIAAAAVPTSRQLCAEPGLDQQQEQEQQQEELLQIWVPAGTVSMPQAGAPARMIHSEPSAANLPGHRPSPSPPETQSATGWWACPGTDAAGTKSSNNQCQQQLQQLPSGYGDVKCVGRECADSTKNGLPAGSTHASPASLMLTLHCEYSLPPPKLRALLEEVQQRASPITGCPPSFTFSSSSNAGSGTLSTKHPSSPKSARPASPAAMLVFPIDPSKHDDKGPLLPAGTTPLVIPGTCGPVLVAAPCELERALTSASCPSPSRVRGALSATTSLDSTPRAALKSTLRTTTQDFKERNGHAVVGAPLPSAGVRTTATAAVGIQAGKPAANTIWQQQQRGLQHHLQQQQQLQRPGSCPPDPSDVLGLIQLPPLKLPAPGCPRNARKGATSAGARMPVQQHPQHPQHQQHQQQAQQRDIPNMPPPPAVAPASCPGSALPGAAPSCPPPAPSACGPPAVPAPTLAATRGTPAPAAAAAAPVLGLQALTISAPSPSAAAAAGAAAAPSPSAATPAPISAAFPPPIAAPSPSAAAAAAKTSAAFPPPIAAPSPSAAAAAAAAAAAPVGAPKTSMPPPSPRRGHPPPSSPPSRFQPLPPRTLSSADGRPQPPLTLEASRTHPDFPLVPLSPSGLHTPSPSAHSRAKQLQQQQQQLWQSSPSAAAMHHNTSSSHQPHTHMSHHHHPQPHLYLVNPGSCPSWASTPASSCKGTPLGSRAPHALFNTQEIASELAQLRIALASYSLPPPHLSAPSLDYTTSPPLIGFEHAAVPQCASSPRLSPPQPHSYGNHCQDQQQQQQQQQQLHLKHQQQQPLSPRCDPSMGGLSGNVAFEGEGNAARGTCRSRGATAELSTVAAGTVGSVGADACNVHPHFASGAPPLVQQNHRQSSRGSSRSAAGWPMLQGSASTPGVQQHQQQWQQQDSSNDGSCTATARPATPPHFCVDETTHSSITRSPPDTLNDQQNRHQRVRENSRRGGRQQERCATAGGVRENSRGGGQEGLLPLPQLRLPEQAPQPAASPFCLVPPSSTAAMPLAPPPPTPLPLQPPLLSTAPTPAAANAGQLPCSPNSHSVLPGQQLQHSRSGVAPNETMHVFDPASLSGSDCAAAAATPANLSVHPLLPHSAYPTSITSGTSWHLSNQHQTSAQGPASIHEAPGTEAEPDLLTGPAVWCLPSRHGRLKIASHSPAAATAAAVAATTSSSIIGSHSLATVSPNAGPVQLAKALGASLVRAAAKAAQRMRVVATNVGRGFVLGLKLGLVGECGAPGFPIPKAGNKSHGVVPGGVGGLVEVHSGVQGECGSPSGPVPGAGNESHGGVQQLQQLLQSDATGTLTQQQQQQQLLLCDEDVAELVRAVHVLLEAPQQRWSRGRAAQFAAAKLALRS